MAKGHWQIYNWKATKKKDQKLLKALIEKGKEQGSLTYDEINEVLPNEMMSSEMIDDTLMMFDDMDIEIIESDNDLSDKESATEKKAALNKAVTVSDIGSVTDPVKMYLREMGMVTLLSREDSIISNYSSPNPTDERTIGMCGRSCAFQSPACIEPAYIGYHGAIKCSRYFV